MVHYWKELARGGCGSWVGSSHQLQQHILHILQSRQHPAGHHLRKHMGLSFC